MTPDEIFTRLLLRLEEQWRDRNGGLDMDVGFRTGILTAINIVRNLKDDADAAADHD